MKKLEFDSDIETKSCLIKGVNLKYILKLNPNSNWARLSPILSPINRRTNMKEPSIKSRPEKRKHNLMSKFQIHF